MEILRFLFYAFIMYLAYRLIFDFIIPVVRTTRRIRKGFRDMQEQMNQQMGQPRQQDNFSNQQPTGSKAGSGDYIDFEEIKD